MAGVRMLARFELRRRWMTMVALRLLAGIGLGLMVAAVAWRFTAHAAYVAAEGLRSE